VSDRLQLLKSQMSKIPTSEPSRDAHGHRRKHESQSIKAARAPHNPNNACRSRPPKSRTTRPAAQTDRANPSPPKGSAFTGNAAPVCWKCQTPRRSHTVAIPVAPHSQQGVPGTHAHRLDTVVATAESQRYERSVCPSLSVTFVLYIPARSAGAVIPGPMRPVD
jgi:hypothetical protein